MARQDITDGEELLYDYGDRYGGWQFLLGFFLFRFYTIPFRNFIPVVLYAPRYGLLHIKSLHSLLCRRRSVSLGEMEV